MGHYQFPSSEHEKTISQLVEKLSALPHVQGIVLGGSRGLNLATEASDYDLVLYYEQGFPIDRQPVSDIFKVNKLTPTVRRIDGIDFDIFYRNLTKVRGAVLEAQQGKFLLHPSNNFPQGNLSLSLISFLVNFPILWERDEALSRVVSTAVPMHDKLRASMMEFAFRGAIDARKAAKGAHKAGTHESFLVAYCSLFIWHLEIALFAMNSMYPIMSKQTMEVLVSQPAVPLNWQKKVHDLFVSCVSDDLKLSLGLMTQLVVEVGRLADQQALAKSNLQREAPYPFGNIGQKDGEIRLSVPVLKDMDW